MARFASQPGNGDGTRFGESAGEADAQGRQLAPALGAGSIIEGKYRLERLLGEGGMGAVWRAQHLQLDLPVAIKLLRAGSEDANLAERLKLEARAVARLTHPAIVRVFDVDATASGEPFIVMELLEGESLSDLLDRGPLSGVVAVQTLLPIAEGLALAHAKGIVHRDIKPQNVFLTQVHEQVQPKLLDFGIAKLMTSPLPTGSLTDTGVVVGSPDYMSPEQARGKSDVDYRADIWQFCVVLYESISGTTPFDGENYNALMRAIVEDEPMPLPLNETVDERLRELVAWGLAKDRSNRPSSIQELARALAEWLLARGISEDITFAPLGQKWISRTSQNSLPRLRATAVSEQPASRVAPLRVAAVAALLLLGCGLVWAFLRKTAVPSVDLRPAPSHATLAAVPPRPSSAIVLAPTAPQPSAPSSAGVNSASVGAGPVRASKPSVPKPATSTAGPSSSAKPALDGHDETHELLQAY